MFFQERLYLHKVWLFSFTILPVYGIIELLEVKNMIKLVASDLDGTIIDKAGSIYENNFKAINDLNQKI